MASAIPNFDKCLDDMLTCSNDKNELLGATEQLMNVIDMADKIVKTSRLCIIYRLELLRAEDEHAHADLIKAINEKLDDSITPNTRYKYQRVARGLRTFYDKQVYILTYTYMQTYTHNIYI